MRWRIEDAPERAAFREQFRGWLREVLPDGWLEAVYNGYYAPLYEIPKSLDVVQWQRTIGASGYGAPLWPKEYGGPFRGALMQGGGPGEVGRYPPPPPTLHIL